jgi:sulfate transport system ATP-binding protein
VRPHELEVLRAPSGGSVAATLERALRIGAGVRMAFRRRDDGASVEVELPREAHARLALEPGATAWLRPRRVRHFEDPGTLQDDPATLI